MSESPADFSARRAQRRAQDALFIPRKRLRRAGPPPVTYSPGQDVLNFLAETEVEVWSEVSTAVIFATMCAAKLQAVCDKRNHLVKDLEALVQELEQWSQNEKAWRNKIERNKIQQGELEQELKILDKRIEEEEQLQYVESREHLATLLSNAVTSVIQSSVRDLNVNHPRDEMGSEAELDALIDEKVKIRVEQALKGVLVSNGTPQRFPPPVPRGHDPTAWSIAGKKIADTLLNPRQSIESALRFGIYSPLITVDYIQTCIGPVLIWLAYSVNSLKVLFSRGESA